jgi:hypothetical protein
MPQAQTRRFAVCACLLLTKQLAQGTPCTNPVQCVDPSGQYDLTPLCTQEGTQVTWGGASPGTYYGDMYLNPCDGLISADSGCTFNGQPSTACLDSNQTGGTPEWTPVGNPPITPASWLRPGDFFDPDGVTGIRVFAPTYNPLNPVGWSVTITFHCNSGGGADTVEMYNGRLPPDHTPPPNSPPHAPGFVWASSGQLNLTWKTVHACGGVTPPGPPPGPGGAPPTPPNEGGMSGGWAIILTVTIGMGLYCGLGALYNQRKYMLPFPDNVPQSEFWKDVPGLVRTFGLVFVCA